MRISLLRTATLALALTAVLAINNGAFAASAQNPNQQGNHATSQTYTKMAPTLWE